VAFEVQMMSRHQRGTLTVEYVVGIIVLTILALAMVDFAVVMLGAQYNFAVCTESAQVAASGPPQLANLRALTVVDRSRRASQWFVQSLEMPEAPVVSLTASQQAQSAGGGPIAGTVCVTTLIHINLPIIGPLIGKDAVVLKANRTFPFTYCSPVQ
jgi:Flp pilus assembly protein TadG